MNRKGIALFCCLLLSCCTKSDIVDENIVGIWKNNDGTKLIFYNNYTLRGEGIKKNIFSNLLGVDTHLFDFSGSWDLEANKDEIFLSFEKSSNRKLSFGCPIYIERKGILGQGDIEYIYFVTDVESETKYTFIKE